MAKNILGFTGFYLYKKKMEKINKIQETANQRLLWLCYGSAANICQPASFAVGVGWVGVAVDLPNKPCLIDKLHEKNVGFIFFRILDLSL